ncbi:dihydrodipicolinate synthase family protein, partial [Mycobacterium tuberculosis]|nr:dihydrodipicolinate synthase family protein [Mycobacterium tuberculosis]
LKAVAAAGDLPVMIYSNRIAYRVDVTSEILAELASDKHFVAIKESSDDVRRTTDIINTFGKRYDLFTGVDNLAFEALTAGAIGWVAGLVTA